jgi:hypothetical protein
MNSARRQFLRLSRVMPLPHLRNEQLGQRSPGGGGSRNTEIVPTHSAPRALDVPSRRLKTHATSSTNRPRGQDELENVAQESTRTIDIDQFVARDEIDPRYIIRPYYLVPGRFSR